MNDRNLSELIGQDLYDSNGSKIGPISEIFLDDATDAAEWALVHTGIFGTKNTFVPMQGLSNNDGKLQAAFDEDKIKGAPKMDADDHLDEQQEAQLYSYYGLSASEQASDSLMADGGRTAGTSGGSADDAMTRSEEEVDVNKTRTQTGKARLRKHLVTEQRTITVPVTREVARLETEPITDANRAEAMSGKDLTEGEFEVTLSEEQVDISKHVEPKERVRLETEEVTEDVKKQVDLTKEQIDVEGADDDAKSRR